jgi:hypothetical protein
MTSCLATSRRTQLDLLARVCERNTRACLAMRAADDSVAIVNTRFLALEPNALCLHWPRDERAAGLTPGVTAEVRFTHAGGRYAFKAELRARVWRRVSGKGRVAALMLALPLRVERREQRRSLRTPLTRLSTPLTARLTSVSEPDLGFTLRASDISAAGLGGVSRDPVAGRLKTGGLFWAEFALPDRRDKIEFVVRLAHWRTIRRSGDVRVKLGCGFCPADDPAAYQDNLRRLDRFVAQQQQASPTRTAARSARRR